MCDATEKWVNPVSDRATLIVTYSLISHHACSHRTL
jgi:hypothetical protein